MSAITKGNLQQVTPLYRTSLFCSIEKLIDHSRLILIGIRLGFGFATLLGLQYIFLQLHEQACGNQLGIRSVPAQLFVGIHVNVVAGQMLGVQIFHLAAADAARNVVIRNSFFRLHD